MTLSKWKKFLFSVFLVLVGAGVVAVPYYVFAQSINSASIPNANFNSLVPTPATGWLATTWNNSGVNVIAEYEPAQGVTQSIAFSTTPAINVSQGGIIQFKCTTAGASISPTFTGFSPGLQFDFIFVQNGTTACTLTYPSNVLGGQTVGTTLNDANIQSFVVSASGVTAYSEGAGSTNLAGTP